MNPLLQSSHPEEYKNDYIKYQAEKFLVQKKKPKNLSSFESEKATCYFSQSEFENNVAHFVMDTLVPVSIVEHPSFRNIFYSKQIF